jgi:hypothetical protein
MRISLLEYRKTTFPFTFSFYFKYLNCKLIFNKCVTLTDFGYETLFLFGKKYFVFFSSFKANLLVNVSLKISMTNIAGRISAD